MSQWLQWLRKKRLAVLGASVVLVLAASTLWGLFGPHPDPYVEAVRKRGYPTSLAELDAWYPAIPAAENAALVYTNAFAMLTNSEGPITNFMGKNWLPALGQCLSTEEKSELTEVLKANQAALRLLYAAPASARSRYPIRMEEGFVMLLPHLVKIKQSVSLLTAEALLHATDGDAEQTTQAFLAAGRVADSLAEEPVTISQLVRYAAWGILLPRLERALSLTAFTDAQLASLQQMVVSAERPRAMLRAFAGEQTCGLSVFTDRKGMEMAFQGFQPSQQPAQRFRIAAGVSLLRITGLLQRDKAFYCDNMAKCLAALELPYPARTAACRQFAALTNVPPRFYVFSRMLLPALPRLPLRDADHVALVRAAATALAVERFRLAHATALPDSLQQLTPTCCKAVPTDPCNGRPLRYKKHGSSYAVYCLGSDGADDGGVDWDSNYLKLPQDVAFMVKHSAK